MRLQELGQQIRRARLARGMTQARLAAEAGVSRTTLNQVEGGLFPDLGIRKVLAILDRLDLTLSVRPISRRADPVRMAAIAANVSYKSPLTEDEVLRALLTGKVPPAKRPHFRTLLDEAGLSVLKGIVREARQWTKPGRVERNLAAIGREVGASRRLEEWLTTA